MQIFLPLPLRTGSGGWCFFNEVKRGYKINWSNHRMPPEQDDCVLAALGMLHMGVKCVIPEELGGDYKDKVGAACAGMICCRWRTNPFCAPVTDAVVGDGQDPGRAVRQAFCCRPI